MKKLWKGVVRHEEKGSIMQGNVYTYKLNCSLEVNRYSCDFFFFSL